MLPQMTQRNIDFAVDSVTEDIESNFETKEFEKLMVSACNSVGLNCGPYGIDPNEIFFNFVLDYDEIGDKSKKDEFKKHKEIIENYFKENPEVLL